MDDDRRAPAHRPLDGVRVLDLSRYLPGPFCTLHLAWLGAEVVCVEQPPHGDPMRALPPASDDGVSRAYGSLRRAATCELLDLADPAGRARALELAATCDVVVESFRPGVAERLGVGPAALRAAHPRLVYCSISGYGQTGPWAQAPGHDLNYEAAAGLLEQTGTASEVAAPPVPLADLAGGMAAATAICAALVRRAATDDGCHLDISLTEAALSLHAMGLAPMGEPGSARGAGTLTGGLASYRPYRCAGGGWIALAPVEPKFFAALCAAIDRPDLVDRQLDPLAQADVRRELEATFITRCAEEWHGRIAGADGGGACLVRAFAPGEVHEHPQLAARGATVQFGSARVPASPYVVDGVRSDSGQA